MTERKVVWVCDCDGLPSGGITAACAACKQKPEPVPAIGPDALYSIVLEWAIRSGCVWRRVSTYPGAIPVIEVVAGGTTASALQQLIQDTDAMNAGVELVHEPGDSSELHIRLHGLRVAE